MYTKMGIKNLHKLLQKYAPNCYQTIHLSHFSYKKVAIDISLYLYKYKAVSGDNWLESFIYLVSCLRKWDIHCIFIYDNKAPIEKLEEQKRRQESRVKQSDRIKELENEINVYKQGGKPSEKMIEICKKEGLLSLLQNKRQIIDLKVVERKLETMKSMLISITEKDLEISRYLFDILRIPYTKAISEAEAFSSYLSIHGKVDAVLSEDTDVLAYGSPLFLTKIDTFQDTVVCIRYEKVLEEMELSKESFVDLCIMLGCDYNSNIPKVGLEKSYALIKKYKNIDDIKEVDNKEVDKDILKHERCRELFAIPDQIEFDVPYCGIPDFSKVNEFFFVNNLRFNMNVLKKNLDQSELSFVD
jgi:5'-3' exonuclease